MTSGKLKTPADADSESLQAKWVADLGELSMRATDVLRLIELGREYRDRAPGERWHLPQVGEQEGNGVEVSCIVPSTK